MISNSDELYITIIRPNAVAVNNDINLFWGGLLKSMAVRPNPRAVLDSGVLGLEVLYQLTAGLKTPAN